MHYGGADENFKAPKEIKISKMILFLPLIKTLFGTVKTRTESIAINQNNGTHK